MEVNEQTKGEESKYKKSFVYTKNTLFIILIDILIVTFSFLILAWYKPATVRTVFPTYICPFLVFITIWISVSFITGKYKLLSFKRAIDMILTFSFINFIIVSIITILLFALKTHVYSRIILFGTSFLSYLIEIFIFYIIYSKLHKSNNDKKIIKHKKKIISGHNPLNLN